MEKAKVHNKRTRSYVEEVYRQILGKPDVTDIIILNKVGNPVKTTMSRESALEFCGLYGTLLEKVHLTLAKIDPEDELLMLRVRTKFNETLITPDESIKVLVVQNAQDRIHFLT